jgi:hypothetical protein
VKIFTDIRNWGSGNSKPEKSIRFFNSVGKNLEIRKCLQKKEFPLELPIKSI